MSGFMPNTGTSLGELSSFGKLETGRQLIGSRQRSTGDHSSRLPSEPSCFSSATGPKDRKDQTFRSFRLDEVMMSSTGMEIGNLI